MPVSPFVHFFSISKARTGADLQFFFVFYLLDLSLDDEPVLSKDRSAPFWIPFFIVSGGSFVSRLLGISLAEVAAGASFSIQCVPLCLISCWRGLALPVLRLFCQCYMRD